AMRSFMLRNTLVRPTAFERVPAPNADLAGAARDGDLLASGGMPSGRDGQRTATEREVPGPASEPGWSLRVAGIDSEREGADAAMLEIGDGRIGMSGSPIVGHPIPVPE